MALNVNRWLNYAKARIDSAVGSGHESLDRLEAKQEADRADKPWLASDSTAPTFDEARARIAWEADQQAKKAARHQEAENADGPAAEPDDETEPEPTGSPTDRAAGADAKEKGAKPKASGAKGAKAKTDETGAKTTAKTEGPAGIGDETSDDPADFHRRKTDHDSATNEQPAGLGSKGSDTTGGDPATSGHGDIDSGPAPRSPQQIAQDAERETARLELEDRQQKSAERLTEIRRELGIDDPPIP